MKLFSFQYDDSSTNLKQKETVITKKKQPSTQLSHTPSQQKEQGAKQTR